MSEVVKEYLVLQTIMHMKTSAYHPRTNVAVEAYNEFLGGILSKYVEGRPHSRDLFVDKTLLACHRRVHTTTGYSPHYLVFDMEPRRIEEQPTIRFKLAIYRKIVQAFC